MEALRTEVALAVERADARADAQRAAHSARETAMQDTANGLRSQLLEMEVRAGMHAAVQYSTRAFIQLHHIALAEAAS